MGLFSFFRRKRVAPDLLSDVDRMVWAINMYAIIIIDAELLNRYPLITQYNTTDDIRRFAKVALLRATLFCQQAFLETRLNELVESQRRILQVPNFDSLWDSLTEYQSDYYRPEQILLRMQDLGCSPQFVICLMCAEWLYHSLTQNDEGYECSFALETLTARILSFQMSSNS